MANVTDAHRAWIAEAVAAPFCTPRRIPTLGRVRETAEPLPDLFRDLLTPQTVEAEPDMPAPVAEVLAPVPAVVPTMELTFDMGHLRHAHMLDRCEPGENGYVVASPPFYLHDEDEVEPVDEFLGQVVGVAEGRALLFRRRDPCVMDGCDVGQRYVLIRFGDDEDGQVWSMPVEGEEDAAMLQAIRTTTSLYRGWQRKAA
jgi:hypothetical protein